MNDTFKRHGAFSWSELLVDDVDETLLKVEASGGKAVYPPMDVPGVGRMCAIADKSGAVVSIITYEDKECSEESK